MKIIVPIPAGETLKVAKTYGKGKFAKETVVVVAKGEVAAWISRGFKVVK